MSRVTAKGLLRPLEGSVYDAHRIYRILESVLCSNYIGLDGVLKHSAGLFGGRSNYQTACFSWPEGQCNVGLLQSGKQQEVDKGNNLINAMDELANGIRPFSRYTRSCGGTFANSGSVWYSTNASTRGLPTPYASNSGRKLVRYINTKSAGDVTPISASHNRTFKVEATYVGSNINVYDLLKLPIYSANFKAVHKGSALIGLESKHTEIHVQQVPGDLMLGSYMAVTSYGSAVFFDTPSEVRDECLDLVKEFVHDPLVRQLYTEEYTISINPSLSSWSKLEPECIQLQQMDLRNLQVIAQVLAQSVALDYYSSHVERTMETFCSLNQEMTETANISKLNKQVILQLVAENNIVMTEIISKLGVHERYDIAWKHAKYGNIWEFLRSELEMENRFETLDMKLNLVQDNLKYFLEILQNRKSDTLEWIIIILIGVEIALSVYELGSKVH